MLRGLRAARSGRPSRKVLATVDRLADSPDQWLFACGRFRLARQGRDAPVACPFANPMRSREASC
jgi:hypothetical protein